MKWDSGGNVMFGCERNMSRMSFVPLLGQPTMKMGESVIAMIHSYYCPPGVKLPCSTLQ